MMKIWVVDAFTNKPYSGNPAAVTIVDEFPDDVTCHKVAAEMNLSETAFIKPLNQNHFHIRWFTPTTEVKLCGHATLASVHVLNQNKLITSNEITFESLSGILKASINEYSYTLDFPLQITGPAVDKKNYEDKLGLKILAAEQAMDCIILELASEQDIKQFNPSPSTILSLDCRGLIITTKGTTDYDFVSRYFAPKVGLNEDPVTGSAHCKLADYWQKKLNKTKFKAFQASKRGGELELIVQNERLLITGQAITVYCANWLIA